MAVPWHYSETWQFTEVIANNLKYVTVVAVIIGCM
jgi:hypothetical protein